MLRFVVAASVAAWMSSSVQAQAPKPSGPSAPPAKAPEAVPTEPRATTAAFGDWVLACQRPDGAAPTVCEVAHSVQIQGQPAPIVQLAIGRGATPGALRLTMALPPNVILTEQPKIAADEKDNSPLALTWVRCLPGGCVAQSDLTEVVTKKWRGMSTQGRINFKDGIGRELAIPFSFRGLDQALEAFGKK